ncbi:MAG TPA: hypothetical protein ENJ82_11720 [Bacteroidetes bacterium]|nr:hypothetical protein [Bacteroidota bacterium]
MVRMLSRLNRKQLKGFQSYLACDLFNTNATLEKLCDYLLANALNNSEKPLLDFKMTEDLGLSTKIHDKLFSQLLQHLNRFVYMWSNRDKLTSEYAETFQFWMNHDLEPELLEREYRKMKRKVSREPASESDILHHLQLEHQYAIHRTFQPRKGQANLFATHHELLDHYYWLTKLKYLCASVNAAQIFRRPIQQIPFEVPKTILQQFPAIGLAYYRTYHLLREAKPEFIAAQEQFEFLEKFGKQFSVEDQRNLYGFLLTVSSLGMNQGKGRFESLILEIYDASLKGGFLIQHGKISPAHFKNIVSLKSRMGKLEETSAFIKKYQGFLPSTDKKELLAYCWGLLAFYEKNYEESIAKFRTIISSSPEDLFWGLEARNMLWKAYFEGGENLGFAEKDEMLKLYHSFRLYVKRNSRVSDHFKTCYENFILIFNQLIRTDERGHWASSKEEFEALLAETQQSNALMHKKWLVEAIQRKIASF